MSVRILLIEDDPSFIEGVVSVLQGCGPDVDVTLAKSRDAATAALGREGEGFDLAVLDLKLPTSDGALDADVEHGRFVLQRARALAPGMPLVILTGSPAHGFINDFLGCSEQVDVWGGGQKRPTVHFLAKNFLDELAAYLMPVVSAVRGVRDVEVRPRGSFNLSWSQSRLLKILARRKGGASCRAQRISGGLSGADVFRVTIHNDAGGLLFNTIVKIARPEVVQRETENYNTYASRLPEAATARFIGDVRFGGGALAAVSYRLAEAYSNSVFDLANSDPRGAAKAIQRASQLTSDWRRGAHERRKTIADVRRRLLGDEKAARIAERYDLSWVELLETRYVQVRWCCIHGDLHGGNILVDDQAEPILIDYGDVGEGPASLDWVALELSALFHPDGCARSGDWPSLSDCASWPDVNAFTRSTGLAPFIAACRGVASDVGAGPRELAASAYSYLLRQLGYDDTDKERILALLAGVKRFIDDT